MSAPLLDAGFLPIASLRPLLVPNAMEADTDWDAELQALGKGIAESFNGYCNRTLQRGTSLVYSRPANCSVVVLPAYPVEQVTAAAVVYDGSSTSVLDGIVNTFASPGIVSWGYTLGSADEQLQVTFDGGYWLNDGNSQPSGSTELPADIVEAWVEQMQAVIKTRKLFWNASVGDPDEETARMGTLEVVPHVRTIMNRYRRMGT